MHISSKRTNLKNLFKICTDSPDDDQLVDILKSLGMNSLSERLVQTKISKSNSTFEYDVVLNGKILGYVSSNSVEQFTKKLRYLKALASVSSSTTENVVPKYLEICHLPRSSYSLYPGLFLFTTPGRMMRPTRNLQTHDIEFIGTLEQCYLHVIISPEEFVENVNFYILI